MRTAFCAALLALGILSPIAANAANQGSPAYTATGGTTPRTIGDRAAENGLNARDLGAVCDGTTNDTTSLTALQSAGGGTLPKGVVCNATTLGMTSATGPFVGRGQWKDAAGNVRAPRFIGITAAPSSFGMTTSEETTFTGDLRGVDLAQEKIITGSATAGTPTSTYLIRPELATVFSSILNQSGHNESLSGNVGRTGIYQNYYRVNQFGQGDLTALGCFGIVASQLASATSWLAEPAVECLASQLFAGADHVYIEVLGDLDIMDQGFDIAGHGIVYNANRTNAAETLGANWSSLDLQSIGTMPVDSQIRMTGPAMVGFDLTKLSIANYTLAAYSISVAGTGYTTGDIVTVPAGTLLVGAGSVNSAATTFVVTASAGVVTNVVPVTSGIYSAPPTAGTPGTVTPSGGTGTGLQLNVTYFANNAALLPVGSCLRFGASNGGSFTNTAVVGAGLSICSAAGAFSIGSANNISTVPAGGNSIAIGTNNLVTQPHVTMVGVGGYDDAQSDVLGFSGAAQNGQGSLQKTWRLLRGVTAGNTTPVRLTTTATTANGNNSYLVVAGSAHNGQVTCQAVDRTNNDVATWDPKVVRLSRVTASNTVYSGTLSSGVATAPDYSTGSGGTASMAFQADTSNQGFQATFVAPTGNTHVWDVSCAMDMNKVL